MLKVNNLHPTAAAAERANEHRKQQQQKRTALNVWREAAIRDTISRKNHKLGSLGDLI